MSDAEYELARLKEAIANRPDWEKLWAEQTERAEAAEQERDALREALKQIAEHEMSFGADGYTISARCKDIARAALEAKP